MKVLVGSMNPPKLESVKQAFEAVWPDQISRVEGRPVSSGVSDQPMNEAETLQGARNRAQKLLLFEADYFVGIEGGLIYSADRWMECGWVVVLDQDGHEGLAASAKIMVPKPVHDILMTGATLSDAFEKLYGIQNIGRGGGFFGFMTGGAVDRVRAYTDAVAFALARFVRPELFKGE